MDIGSVGILGSDIWLSGHLNIYICNSLGTQLCQKAYYFWLSQATKVNLVLTSSQIKIWGKLVNGKIYWFRFESICQENFLIFLTKSFHFHRVKLIRRHVVNAVLINCFQTRPYQSRYNSSAINANRDTNSKLSMPNQWARYCHLSMSTRIQALKRSMPNQLAQSRQLSISIGTQAQLSMSTWTQALKRSMPNQWAWSQLVCLNKNQITLSS